MKSLLLSLRGVLCCIAVGGMPFLHCTWLVARVGVCVVSQSGETPEPAFTAALGVVVRVSVLCVS
jgi:hypothetical protein